MTTEYSGAGDPKRTIELLWGVQAPPRRGPRPKLTVPGIVAAAIEIADTEGLAALSMRRVAETLGIAPMSLYTYVPGKAELIDLMLDTAYGELLGPERPGGGWRARLEEIARDHWALFHRHPWMLQVAKGRPPLGPNITGVYERQLRAVDGIGLADLEMDQAVSLVAGYVQGIARESVEAAQAERLTGITDLQWWEAHAPHLEKVADTRAYPLAARVGAAAGEEYGAASAPGRVFEFGLARILDGIEVLIRDREDPKRGDW